MDFEAEKIRCHNLPYYLDQKLRDIFDVYKQAVHKRNTSMFAIVDGKSGMGKSTLSLQLAKYCDPNFDINKVLFTPESFLEALSTAELGDAFVFDEAMVVSNRSSMSQVNKMITQAMSMIRSKQIFIFFNVNSLFDLDKNLSIYRADLLLHCYGSNLGSRGKVMAFFKGADDIDRLKMLYLLGKKYYDYSKPRSNFYAKFTSHFILDQNTYEKRKQEGVNNFLNSTSGRRTSKRDSMFEKAIDVLHREQGLTLEAIGDKLGVTKQAISYILKNL